MKAQRKVYGYFFLEQLLSGEVLKDMIKNYPVEPSKDGVETVSYLYADYFLARKMASDERMDIMKLLGKELESSTGLICIHLIRLRDLQVLITVAL